MKRPPESQLDRFKEAARKLGCDEDESRFDEKLGKLIRPKSKASEKENEKDGG